MTSMRSKQQEELWTPVRRADANRTRDATGVGLSRISTIGLAKAVTTMICVCCCDCHCWRAEQIFDESEIGRRLSGPPFVRSPQREASSIAVRAQGPLLQRFGRIPHALASFLYRQLSPLPRTGPIEMRAPTLIRGDPSPGTLPWRDCMPRHKRSVPAIVPLCPK
jgi:hypothetical protein